MGVKWMIFSALLALALVAGVVVAAAGMSAQEVEFDYSSGYYEVNQGADGLVYLSANGSGDVFVIQPTGFYTRYAFLDSIIDAQPDSAGNIWFTNANRKFGRISPQAGTLTTWEVPVDHNLWGVTIDEGGLVWMTEFIGGGSVIRRFDPHTTVTATQLCTFSLKNAYVQSYYILQSASNLWIGNWGQGRIYKIDIHDLNNLEARWWQLPGTAPWPMGLDLDLDGNLWYTDQNQGEIGRLAPGIHELTRFELPLGVKPRLLDVTGDGVWYTEETSRTVGILRPEPGMGVTTTLTTGATGVELQCGAAPKQETTLSVFTGTIAWQDVELTPLVDANGWQVYQLPAQSLPYGVTRSAGAVWITDQGRDKLLRIRLESRVYLPLVLR